MSSTLLSRDHLVFDFGHQCIEDAAGQSVGSIVVGSQQPSGAPRYIQTWYLDEARAVVWSTLGSIRLPRWWRILDAAGHDVGYFDDRQRLTVAGKLIATFEQQTAVSADYSPRWQVSSPAKPFYAEIWRQKHRRRAFSRDELWHLELGPSTQGTLRVLAAAAVEVLLQDCADPRD